MKVLIVILAILFIHWFADFVIQSDEDAKGKSTSLKHLLSHTFDYSLVWHFVMLVLILLDILPIVFFWFAPITFIIHTMTDYCTSRLNSILWDKGDVHNFFVSVGFDQFLHYVQLFGTFFILLYL
jgi:hypothetical protein